MQENQSLFSRKNKKTYFKLQSAEILLGKLCVKVHNFLCKQERHLNGAMYRFSVRTIVRNCLFVIVCSSSPFVASGRLCIFIVAFTGHFQIMLI